MKPRRVETQRLAAMLGDDHDLALLQETIIDHPVTSGDSLDVPDYMSLLRKRRDQLQKQLMPLAEKLFADSASTFTQRIRVYWIASGFNGCATNPESGSSRLDPTIS